tara:strand:- start:1195 stop:2469 length:1275 start_codon:yes stop_codon:yes gene_type:complete
MSIEAVIGAQWGDEGKGKIVDLLSENMHFVARYQGGANAGHTVYYKDQKLVLHQIPAGILRKNCKCILGKGMVIDPVGINEEINLLKENSIDFEDRIFIDYYAHVVTPIHKMIDKNNELKTKNFIGTTCKGIGPTYADKYNRIGIRIIDLLDVNSLKNKINNRIEIGLEKKEINLTDNAELNVELDKFYKSCELIKPFIFDSHPTIHNNINNAVPMLIEGAQGTLLDIDHGTFPFVTSSNCSSAGISTGLGIPSYHLSKIIGIFKAYVTRVGGGPFPTELFDNDGQKLQTIGKEVGATTGRARRCGWFDLVAAKYSVEVNGLTHIALTKLDILDNFETIKICTHYEYQNQKITNFSNVINDLENVKPIYREFSGWCDSTCNVKAFNEFPSEVKDYVNFISDFLKTPISIISLGPKRDQIINIET